MSRLIDQISDKSSLLLMYAAGELPADERAQVDRALAGDADLRAELDVVRAAGLSFVAGMVRLDAADRLPVDESSAIRNVGRLVRQWQARTIPSQKPGKRAGFYLAGMPVDWRVAGLAAAAAGVLVAVMLVSHGGGGAKARGRPDIAQKQFDLEAVRSLARVDDLPERPDEAGAMASAMPSPSHGLDAETPIFDIPLPDAAADPVQP